jgi:hypothetical protein
MTDLKKLADDATTKAVIAVGRDAAKRAVDGLLSGDDASVPEPEKAEASKSKRWKLIAMGVLGLFLVVGLIGLLLSYWYWFLGAGVLGVAGLIGYSRLRSRIAKRSLPKEAAKDEDVAAPPVRISKAADPEPVRPSAEERRAEVESRARALAEAQAVREQEVDEELAAMKARLKH